MSEKKAMTIQEAGRKGGLKTKRKMGKGFYEKIGKKGGQITKRAFELARKNGLDG